MWWRLYDRDSIISHLRSANLLPGGPSSPYYEARVLASWGAEMRVRWVWLGGPGCHHSLPSQGHCGPIFIIIPASVIRNMKTREFRKVKLLRWMWWCIVDIWRVKDVHDNNIIKNRAQHNKESKSQDHCRWYQESYCLIMLWSWLSLASDPVIWPVTEPGDAAQHYSYPGPVWLSWGVTGARSSPRMMLSQSDDPVLHCIQVTGRWYQPQLNLTMFFWVVDAFKQAKCHNLFNALMCF